VNVFGVAEVEYAYRARQFGFPSYMVRSCITHEDVGRYRGLLQLRYERFQLAFRIRYSDVLRLSQFALFWLHQRRQL